MYVFSLFFKHALLMEANSFIMLWHASLLLQVTRTVTQIVYSEYLILLSLGLAAAQKRRKKNALIALSCLSGIRNNTCCKISVYSSSVIQTHLLPGQSP